MEILLVVLIILVFALSVLAIKLNNSRGKGLSEQVIEEKVKAVRAKAESDVNEVKRRAESEIAYAKSAAEIKISRAMAELESKLRQAEAEFESKRSDDRKLAVMGSRNAITGRAAEQLAPLMSNFPYNIRDVRFAGHAPFDYLVFDGLSNEEGEVSVVFLEVKLGQGSITPSERRVRDAVAKGRVKYEIFRVEND